MSRIWGWDHEPGGHADVCRASISRRIIPKGKHTFRELPLDDAGLADLNSGKYEFPVELIKELSKIDGVKRVIVEPYQVIIFIARAFDWKPMKDQLVNALKKLFPKEERDGVDIDWDMEREQEFESV
jgi:hypothetical protein